MSPIVVWTLVMIVRADAGTTPLAYNYPTIEACQSAEDAAHEAAKNAIGVLDVGTLCIKSSFDPLLKPRA